MYSLTLRVQYDLKVPTPVSQEYLPLYLRSTYPCVLGVPTPVSQESVWDKITNPLANKDKDSTKFKTKWPPYFFVSYHCILCQPHWECSKVVVWWGLSAGWCAAPPGGSTPRRRRRPDPCSKIPKIRRRRSNGWGAA